ncbi:hypothetical protein EU537_09590 [Candidatus Thorarchaeota archaeon]|nr:MAG: hypothetical protein EU537_09590 [Candidatus Thorarchaeota archaeon]
MMNELTTIRNSFVAFIDGLWWGLRDNVGALSMYEGYANGFKQIGREMAKQSDGNGAEGAAQAASTLMGSLGLEAESDGIEVIVKECPFWNRILEEGLEYSFHIEEICWMPLLEGIGEQFGVRPMMKSSLRLNHVARGKNEYKKSKASKALKAGKISKDEYQTTIDELDSEIEKIPEFGRYQYK